MKLWIFGSWLTCFGYGLFLSTLASALGIPLALGFCVVGSLLIHETFRILGEWNE